LAKETFASTSGTSEDDERLDGAWGARHRPKGEFTHARDGDHLMVPFECDYCIFFKLRGKVPDPSQSKDNLLMGCIRRVNLDAFWSRATTTVHGNRDGVRRALKLSEQVGLSGPYIYTGELPKHDHCGYEVAIQTVLSSLRRGKHSETHTQWDTIRKVKTVYSNHYKSTPQANISVLAIVGDKGQTDRLLNDVCSSYWFGRFTRGCKNRMGQDWRPNMAFPIPLLLRIIEQVRIQINESDPIEEGARWKVFGAYAVLAYVISLRGSVCTWILQDYGDTRMKEPLIT
jgi:hypothetical protein